MLEIFNTRELALFSWLFIIVLWVLSKKTFRKSLKRVFKNAFVKNLMIVYLFMFSWIALSAYILAKAHIWTWAQLKTTLLWTISYAFVALFSINKIQQSKAYFKDAAKDLLTFTVAIEIIVGFHTFSYWVEMLILLFVTLLVGCVAFAGKKAEYARVKSLFNNLLALIGLTIIGFSIYWVVTHFKDFAAVSTFMDTIVSSFLTLLFLPFLYFLSVYMAYETGFIGLTTALRANPELIGFAKRKAILQFKFRATEFNRWKNSLFLHPVTTKSELIDSLRQLKKLNEVERNPPAVDSALGWSPYKAKDFLISEGLSTRFYIHHYEDEWGASSDYLDLKDDEIIPNRIAYYVSGNQYIAMSLKLCLSVNAPKQSVSAQVKLAQIVKCLYKEALQRLLPSEIENGILNGYNISILDGNNKITILKDNWPTQKGFNLDFEIFKEQ
ncbi:hypothetical protein KTO58_19265 [Chitinophaga pendula]|uniref:hypothetical protein n=1 Tax=Chitinophaga TaxID=79328 RepID=UPI000BAF3A8A|nr:MULTISPECIES: hypothetical protein [Chitinophaga]ASZ11189.1 hypothetical protein CK934_09545 [Chitinophaga sp. MD30]UCJ05815.1 hypothetical protein KTO58_19265 [Chitinophaga pendula]